MRRIVLSTLAAGAAGLVATLGLSVSADTPPPAATAKAPAELTGYTEKMAGSDVKFDMVPIPGGTFVMGSPESEKGRSPDEGPQHSVTVKPFWMGKCEVTWDEFDLYWKSEDVIKPAATPGGTAVSPGVPHVSDAITRPTPPYVDETYGHPREKHPALCMTHHNCMEYCRWLSLKTGKNYRLPTEAEWEYAARAGTTTAYFFGEDPSKLDEYAWYAKNSEEATHDVGTKRPNPWGLYDMYGNVMEWCIDHYQKDAYATFAKTNPTLSPVLVPTDKRYSHVARGGTWSDDAARCRSAARRASEKSWMKDDPQRPQSIWWLTRFDVIGFRVVRPLEEQPELRNLRSKITKQSD